MNIASRWVLLLKANQIAIMAEIEIEGTQYTYKLTDDFVKEINLFEKDNDSTRFKLQIRDRDNCHF